MIEKEHFNKIGQSMTLSGFSAVFLKLLELDTKLITIITTVILFSYLLLLYKSSYSKYISFTKVLFVLLLIASFLVGYDIYSDEKRLSQDGIEKYYFPSNQLLPELDERIKTAEHNLLFFGTNFFISADEKRQLLLDAAIRGVHVKFLVMNPDIEYFDLVAKTIAPDDEVEALVSECRKGLFNLKTLFEEVQEAANDGKLNGSLEVKLMDVIPQNRMYMFDMNTNDGVEYFIPYINGAMSSQVPGYKIVATSQSAQAHFKAVNKIWSQSKTIFSGKN